MIDGSPQAKFGSKKIKVWDPVIRLLHLVLAASVLVSALTQESDYQLHRVAGYIVLTVAVFRCAWGFVGPLHARFASFVRRPAKTFRYVNKLFQPTKPKYLGHNPLGGWMTIIMLLTLFVVSVTGVVLDAGENFAGPLAGLRLYPYTGLAEHMHKASYEFLLVLCGLHLAGVLIQSILQKENLSLSIITGNKWLK